MLETNGVIISLIIIFVIVFVAANIAEYYEYLDRKIYKIASAVCIIGIVAEVFIVCMPTDTSNTPTEEIQKWKNNLVAIRSGVRLEGSATGGLTFVVADIGEEDVYTFFYETSDGGYKKGKINSSNVTIYETDEEEPSIIKYKRIYDELSLEDETKSEVDYTKDYGEEYDVWYEIFVPEGTIVRNFSLE